ncbi:MAG: 30S ribosomal protein S3, partial [bacterium]|nr:30S ribosomal protein S3 [bacterium]
MGQKTHPYGFRLSYNKTWHSRWYAAGEYAGTGHQDLRLRSRPRQPLAHAGVSEIDSERAAD